MVSVAVRRLGDIDADGGVNQNDKTALTTRLNGGPAPDLEVYDLDGDGGVNQNDKTLLTTMLNGGTVP